MLRNATNSKPEARFLLTVFLIIVATAHGWAQDSNLGQERIYREFSEIATALGASTHPYLGTHQVNVLSKQINDASASFAQRTQWRAQLCYHMLRLGRTADAMAPLAEAFADYRRQGITPPTALLKAQAMTFWRQAEVANCIQRHVPDCCVFPLANGGIHTDTAPARQAHNVLRSILTRDPNDKLVQWLLNLSAMALGEFPEAVPEAFRIPANMFPSPQVIGRFVDVAPSRGLDTFNLCGGVTVADFNGDDQFDIITSTYDPNESLIYHHGLGNDQFEAATKASGLVAQLGGLNLISADYDNDSDPDLFVLRGAWLGESGRIRNSLLRNNGPSNPHGPATFTDVSHRAGLADVAYPTQTAAWGDFDNDGDLDLFVGNESLKHLGYAASDFPCQLFINDGKGHFQDRAPQAGVTNDRFCKGIAAGDYDNDGDLDLYVSNAGKNRLYRNDGNLKFIDVADSLGVTKPEGRSFATWFFDYNNDAWLDLFVTGYEATPADLLADYRGEAHEATFPKLYQNTGDGHFKDVTRAAGLEHVYLPMGANFGDVDFDGWLDIYLATGDPEYETLMPNVLLRNIDGKRFEDVTFAAGLGHLQKGHGVAFVDLDDDGDQDLFHQLGGFYPGDKFHNALFLNPGNDNRHVYIKLKGAVTNRDAIGAKITVTVRTKRGARDIHRQVGIVSSFGGSPLRQEIGLGQAESIEKVRVIWPTSGAEQRFKDIPLDANITIIEGNDSLQ